MSNCINIIKYIKPRHALHTYMEYGIHPPKGTRDAFEWKISVLTCRKNIIYVYTILTQNNKIHSYTITRPTKYRIRCPSGIEVIETWNDTTTHKYLKFHIIPSPTGVTGCGTLSLWG